VSPTVVSQFCSSSSILFLVGKTGTGGAFIPSHEWERVFPRRSDKRGKKMMINEQDVNKSNAQMPLQILQMQELDVNELLIEMSHILRSPLTAIKGYTETLLRQENRITEQERHEFLQIIKEASDDLAGTIDQMMKGAQVNIVNFRIEIVPFNKLRSDDN
jgi:signal transduction histidine kinase